MKTWYVEVTRTTNRFGYVTAKTKAEAIKKATEAGDGDVDGLTTNVSGWTTEAAHEYTPHPDDGADAKILGSAC